MAINYPYDPSQLTENETLYEELIKIRRYLDKNPIYKIYNTIEEGSTLIFEYDLDLVQLAEGQTITKFDVVLFPNDLYAVVNTVDEVSRKYTVSDVYKIDGDTNAQAQIDALQKDVEENRKAIALNIDGIAHVEQIKQDKLPQVDLDNIASINQMKDDIANKQDALTSQQMQSIGEIDVIKGIAIQNQSDVTELSASVLANTQAIDTKINGKLNVSIPLSFKKGSRFILYAYGGGLGTCTIKDGNEILFTKDFAGVMAWFFVTSNKITFVLLNQNGTYDFKFLSINNENITISYNDYLTNTLIGDLIQ